MTTGLGLSRSVQMLTGEERQVQPEDYPSHSAILLQTLGTGERAIRVLKIRGTKVDAIPRPYQIGPAGIEVHSDQSIFNP